MHLVDWCTVPQHWQQDVGGVVCLLLVQNKLLSQCCLQCAACEEDILCMCLRKRASFHPGKSLRGAGGCTCTKIWQFQCCHLRRYVSGESLESLSILIVCISFCCRHMYGSIGSPASPAAVDPARAKVPRTTSCAHRSRLHEPDSSW